MGLSGTNYVQFQTDHLTHFAIAGSGGDFTYDIYIIGHKNDAWDSFITPYGLNTGIVVEFENNSSQIFPSFYINTIGEVKKNDIIIGETGSIEMNLIPFKSYKNHWKLE